MPAAALQLLQERGLNIPFIVVSGTIGEDVAVDMMRRGVADYLLKDRLGRLGPAVKHALMENELRQEKIQAEDELQASEARFQTFMRHSPALAFIKDESGHTYMSTTRRKMRRISLPNSPPISRSSRAASHREPSRR